MATYDGIGRGLGKAGVDGVELDTYVTNLADGDPKKVDGDSKGLRVRQEMRRRAAGVRVLLLAALVLLAPGRARRRRPPDRVPLHGRAALCVVRPGNSRMNKNSRSRLPLLGFLVAFFSSL